MIFKARYYQTHFGAGLQLVGFMEGEQPIWMGSGEQFDRAERELEVKHH